MPLERSRPRFEKHLQHNAVDFADKFKKKLLQSDSFSGCFTKDCFQVSIRKDRRHFYSPRLDLQVIATEKGCLLKGLYGPEASVWLMWTFGYGIAAIYFFLSSMFGFIQMSLNTDPWGLWGIPMAIFMAIVLYLSSFAGQKLGKNQMKLLQDFVDEAVDNSDLSTNEQTKAYK